MTEICKPTSENIKQAAEIIQNGGLVAMPTETVYGLGANVYNPQAVADIFAAKGRPAFNPLISHIAELDFLKTYAQTDERVMALAKKYWPGPLTFVLPRFQQDTDPAIDLACAGLRTITVRMPNHPVALELIKKSGVPIVAPSEKVDMILDGGPCSVGVESTIIDVTGKHVVLLRAGGLSLEELEGFLNEKILISRGNPDLPSSPGQMLKHYAPAHPMRINAETPLPGEFFIGFGQVAGANLNLSPSGDTKEAAANLFSYMRYADSQSGYTGIAMSPIPETGLGLAINDRIRRAAYKK